MGSSPFQALELEKTIIVQWLNPNFDGFELKFDKKMGLKIDLKIDLPLCPLPNRLISQIQESCDLQGRPLGQTLTVIPKPSQNDTTNHPTLGSYYYGWGNPFS